MKTKNSILTGVLSFVICVAGCNDDKDDAGIKEHVTEYQMPRVAVKQSEGNIFELVEFYLYNDNPEPVPMLNELSSLYDSIV